MNTKSSITIPKMEAKKVGFDHEISIKINQFDFILDECQKDFILSALSIYFKHDIKLKELNVINPFPRQAGELWSLKNCGIQFIFINFSRGIDISASIAYRDDNYLSNYKFMNIIVSQINRVN